VSLDLWERVQAVMDGRYTKKSKQGSEISRSLD